VSNTRRPRFPHEVADLYPTRPSKPLRATGFAPWDVAVGGVSAGIVRLLGLKSFDFGLAIAAADVTSANATLIVGDGRPRRMVSRLARVAGLVEPRLLASTDLDDIIWAVRSNEWQYVVLDRLELIRATSDSIADLDDACFASDTVFIACGGDEVSTQPGLQGLFWRYAVQTVQLVAEYPGMDREFSKSELPTTHCPQVLHLIPLSKCIFQQPGEWS
jgi:hypothetical protein